MRREATSQRCECLKQPVAQSFPKYARSYTKWVNNTKAGIRYSKMNYENSLFKFTLLYLMKYNVVVFSKSAFERYSFVRLCVTAIPEVFGEL